MKFKLKLIVTFQTKEIERSKDQLENCARPQDEWSKRNGRKEEKKGNRKPQLLCGLFSFKIYRTIWKKLRAHLQEANAKRMWQKEKKKFAFASARWECVLKPSTYSGLFTFGNK